MDEELDNYWIQARRLTDQKSVIDYRKQARDKLATWHVAINQAWEINQAWDEAHAMNEAFDLAKTVAAAQKSKSDGRL